VALRAHHGQDPVVTEAVRQRPRRGWKLVLYSVAALLVLEMASSLLWPHIVPRAAVLPRPAERSWYDGCNWHHRYFTHEGLIWGGNEVSTLRGCIEKN
jgi:hypothetical protein